MILNNTFRSYRPAGTITATRVKASEEGLFQPITARVSSALSDEYIEQIRAQARADAAKGRYMDGYDSKQRTGFSAMRDAWMEQYVSPPDRDEAISRVSAAIKRHGWDWKSGPADLLALMSISCTAKVFHGPVHGTSAQIYDGNGEMIAAYSADGGWLSVPTADETRFQYESNQIYREAYNAARAELESAARQAAPAGIPAGFDAKA